MNGADVENTGKYAIAGGNIEIVHLCEQNHSSFKDAYETAIEFYRNDIFYYLYENKIGEYDKVHTSMFLLSNNEAFNINLLKFIFELEGIDINEKDVYFKYLVILYII